MTPTVRFTFRMMLTIFGFSGFLAGCRKTATEPIFSPIENSSVSSRTFAPKAVPFEKTFEGFYADDPQSLQNLENPSRGFRFELMMQAHSLRNPYNGEDYKTGLTAFFKREKTNPFFKEVKLVQVYFYLTPFVNRPISNAALQNIQFVFKELEREGMKVVVRFAYQYKEGLVRESLGQIQEHLRQLKPLLHQNKAMIHVFQAGFLGYWGEWHHSRYDQNRAAQGWLLRQLLSTLPPNLPIQVRETHYFTQSIAGFQGNIPQFLPGKNQWTSFPALSQVEQNRIGFHNDFFVIDGGENSQWDYRFPDQDYFDAIQKMDSAPMDGEMPYDGFGLGKVNFVLHGSQGGVRAAARLWAHSYTSFSIHHNFNTNMMAWNDQWVGANELTEWMKKEKKPSSFLPDPHYFSYKNGAPAKRNVLEFIRDHLGYKIRLHYGIWKDTIPDGGPFQIQCAFVNFGFAKHHEKRKIYLVLTDSSNLTHSFPFPLKTNEILPATVEKKFHASSLSIPTDQLKPGIYQIGISIPEESADLNNPLPYHILLANRNLPVWIDSTNKRKVQWIGMVVKN